MMTVVGPLLVLGLVIALRLGRGTNEKPIARLWFAPLAYAVMIALMLWIHPPPALGWLLFAGGLGLGMVLGNWRGRLFELRLDQESGRLLKRRTPAAILLLGGIVALRFLAAGVLAPGALMLFTDALLGLIFGLLVATRIEIRRRGRRLLRQKWEG